MPRDRIATLLTAAGFIILGALIGGVAGIILFLIGAFLAVFALRS